MYFFSERFMALACVNSNVEWSSFPGKKDFKFELWVAIFILNTLVILETQVELNRNICASNLIYLRHD